ncbi:MAG TPA: hypothetical protein VK203_05020 [Nostocaceae cyanobacterium]|nr:hypothetical protein [Nostocaceae cyanobacterium]
MAYKYRLKSGQVIEADTAQEIKELIQLLENQEISTTHNLPASVPVAENPNNNVSLISESLQSSEPLQTYNSEAKIAKPPSVQDFIQLWNKLDTERARKIMSIFADYGKQKLTSDQLAKSLNVNRASGTMSGINKRSKEVGFYWKDWFRLVAGVYEVNDIAHSNLVEAMNVIKKQYSH